jgi:hypothetical protein
MNRMKPDWRDSFPLPISSHWRGSAAPPATHRIIGARGRSVREQGSRDQQPGSRHERGASKLSRRICERDAVSHWEELRFDRPVRIREIGVIGGLPLFFPLTLLEAAGTPICRRGDQRQHDADDDRRRGNDRGA